jgi:hypothetical protein
MSVAEWLHERSRASAYAIATHTNHRSANRIGKIAPIRFLHPRFM